MSINLTPEYNFTIAQKGYKSLGKYQGTRSRGNQIRFSSNFKSKNNKTIWRLHLTSQNIFNKENGGLGPDDIYFFEQAPNYFELDNEGNQILNEDGSYKMVYYDGYLDRSRLGAAILSENNLYSKRFFSYLQRTILKNSENDIISVGYKFTHEYKKFEYKDQYATNFFGEFFGEKPILDIQRFTKQEHELFAKIDLNKIGKFELGFNNISWINKFKQIEDSISNLPSDLSIDQKTLSANWNKSRG